MLLQKVPTEWASPLEPPCVLPAFVDGSAGGIRLFCHPGRHLKWRTNQRYPPTVIVAQMYRWATHQVGRLSSTEVSWRNPRSLLPSRQCKGVVWLSIGFGTFSTSCLDSISRLQGLIGIPTPVKSGGVEGSVGLSPAAFGESPTTVSNCSAILRS